MKALVTLGILATFVIIFVTYTKTRDLKKLFISLGSFIVLLYLLWIGFRVSVAIFPLKMANIVLGLTPGVSFAGHFIGALAGALIFGIIYLSAPKNKKLF